jgi:hypothetical protein
LKVKVLFDDTYRILATMDGEDCPVEEFLVQGSDSASTGLLTMLEVLANKGFDGVPPKWSHEANKAEKISQLVKGDFRLFFFKGEGRDIAVCVLAKKKTGQKADPQAVAKAVDAKARYAAAIATKTLEVVINEAE